MKLHRALTGFLSILLVVLSSGCSQKEEGAANMTIQQRPFGKVSGRDVTLFTLQNSSGMKAAITNYGAILVSLTAPDRNGKFEDVVLGYETLGEYVKDNPYFGCVVGRYGNRIGKAKFTIDGVAYQLSANDGENHLHGGERGFDKKIWDAEPLELPDASGIKFSYLSPDGEEGYPGNLAVTVTYLLTGNNEFAIAYEAAADKPTHVNLTQHTYFNLAGQGSGDILGHELMIMADRFTPVDAGLITTGELRPVEGTPMDFRTPTAIGDRIDSDYEQIRFGGGYDHNWVLNNYDGALRLAAKVHEPVTGRVMEVFTTEPGIQFYAGNFLNGSHIGKGGAVYNKRYGFCLETQHFPDSPNKPNFPSTLLRPGETYKTRTVYRFSAE